MEKIISFDKQGRIYIPEEIRKKLGYKTLIVNIFGNSICLKPIEDDPILALERIGSSKLKEKSLEKLKKEAREEIVEHAIKKLRRH